MTIGLLSAGLLLGVTAASAADKAAGAPAKAAPRAAGGGALQSGDWSQWRGANRDGIVPQSPPLADAWPKNGPPKLWQSERLPGWGIAGLGSPVVAGG